MTAGEVWRDYMALSIEERRAYRASLDVQEMEGLLALSHAVTGGTAAVWAGDPAGRLAEGGR